MHALFRQSGFDVDGGKVKVGGAANMMTGREARSWIAKFGAGKLLKGEPSYQAWLDVGIAEEEIEETLEAVKKWEETEDAWLASMQVEMLAWK